MRRNGRTWLATLAAAALSAPASVMAHPGHHEGGGGGLLHTLTEPDHLLVLGAGCAAAVLGYGLLRFRNPEKRGAAERASR